MPHRRRIIQFCTTATEAFRNQTTLDTEEGVERVDRSLAVSREAESTNRSTLLFV